MISLTGWFRPGNTGNIHKLLFLKNAYLFWDEAIWQNDTTLLTSSLCLSCGYDTGFWFDAYAGYSWGMAVCCGLIWHVQPLLHQTLSLMIKASYSVSWIFYTFGDTGPKSEAISQIKEGNDSKMGVYLCHYIYPGICA